MYPLKQQLLTPPALQPMGEMVSNEIFAYFYVYFVIKITKSKALEVAVDRKCHGILISRNKAWGIDCIINSVLRRISNADGVCRRPLRSSTHNVAFGLVTFGPESLGMATPRQLDLWATAASCLCHGDKPSRHLGLNLISSRGTTCSTRWEEVAIQRGRGRGSRSGGAIWANWSSRFTGSKNKKQKVPAAPSELEVPESRVHQFFVAAALSVLRVSGLVALLSLLTYMCLSRHQFGSVWILSSHPWDRFFTLSSLVLLSAKGILGSENCVISLGCLHD